MELSRQDYPALVGYLQPSQASSVIGERLKAITKLNTEIADWLLERRKLEETYVLGLRKLARRPQPDVGAGLGIFELPWRRILSATEALAQSHETLAHEIETDVEKPLRDYNSKNSDFQTMTSIQNDLTSLVRELESAQKKAAKAKGKAGKSSAAAAAVDKARSQYESRAPFVFEKLQAVDEYRINLLRDVLTQFQTHEVDQIERNRQNAESCLNALLNLETADEIKIFAARVSGGRSTEVESRDQPAPAAAEPPAAAPANSEPLPPPPKIHDDAESQRSVHSRQGRPSMASSEIPRDNHRPTPLGGLRRLGTVMGRRRSIVIPSGPTSPDREKKFRSPFASFRKNEVTRNFHQMDSQEDDLGPERPIGSSSSRQRDVPTRSSTRTDSVSEDAPRSMPNGRVIPEATPEEESSPPPITTTTAEDKPEPQVIQQQQQPQVDAEGYSTRPDTVDEITRIQREATAAEDSGINLTIRDKPIEEDESEARQALNDMAQTLRLQAQRTGLTRGTGTLRGRRDVRNTIFIPNPPPQEQNTNQGLASAPSPGYIPTPVSNTHESIPSTDGHRDDHPLSDSASIQSSQTLHSLSGPISHPELQSPGLNASIVEKLSVLISGGTVTRSYVVGEVALAYNSNESKPSESQLVRLDNFHVLERVAANPQFVTEVSSTAPSQGDQRPESANGKGIKGQYNIGLHFITGSFPHVAFKYQVHLDSSNLSSYCPVIFTPIWNEEEFQASVIITYSLNPSFVSSQALTSITLKNLALTVSLDLNPVTDEATGQPREVARAVSAAMYPNSASFRRKHSAVVWKLPELVVTAGEDGKFLARFSTTTPWPRKGKVEAKFDTVTSDNSLRLGLSAYLPECGEAAEKGDDDPFADESASPTADSSSSKLWKKVPTERKLSVARYVSS
ncbi:hypothetical protein VTO42DRAFT_5855 [Malbranchea cinnamomea]